jgi:hypothetical protein
MMRHKRLWCAICMLLAILSNGSQANAWWGYLGANNSSSIHINRECVNLSIHLDELSSGQVSPIQITHQGRMISGYHSRYANLQNNDVMLKERTSAMEGSLAFAETTEMRASVENEVTNEEIKEAGQPLVVDTFFERWPVLLSSQRYLRYSGTEINERDFGENNMDYIGTGFFYNTKLEKMRIYQALLQQLNITITADAVNESIKSVDFKANKITRYRTISNSTGISELKYGQASSNQLSLIRGHINYDQLGSQRYYGNFRMDAIMNATSREIYAVQNDTSCCEPCESTK